MVWRADTQPARDALSGESTELAAGELAAEKWWRRADDRVVRLFAVFAVVELLPVLEVFQLLCLRGIK